MKEGGGGGGGAGEREGGERGRGGEGVEPAAQHSAHGGAAAWRCLLQPPSCSRVLGFIDLLLLVIEQWRKLLIEHMGPGVKKDDHCRTSQPHHFILTSCKRSKSCITASIIRGQCTALIDLYENILAGRCWELVNSFDSWHNCVGICNISQQRPLAGFLMK